MAEVRAYLRQRFDSNRLVFWHDPAGEYEAELADLDLDQVAVLRVANDEYGIKYRVLHEAPEDRFLIYRSGSIPHGTANWLLDLELAYGVFTADRAGFIAAKLGRSAIDLGDVVRAHGVFFENDARVDALQNRLTAEDDETLVRAKMSAILLGVDDAHSFSELLRALLVEHARGSGTKFESLSACGLEPFFWGGAQEIYGYSSPAPSILDFTLWIFQQARNGFEADQPGGLQNIRRDFESLRNDRRSEAEMKTLARRAADDLGYAADIAAIDFRVLGSDDVFPQADQKILSALVDAVVGQTISAREVRQVVRDRETSVWYDDCKGLYKAISSGAELLALLGSLDLACESFDAGLERYRSEWYRIDQLYRQFTFAYRNQGRPQPLEPLRDAIELRYLNQFLYPLGTMWQQHVDGLEDWRAKLLPSQSAFYRNYVDRKLREGQKAVVIVSDALRYEIADELGTRIRQEDRYDAELDAMLGVLPSCTPLGMAAVLPHKRLEFSSDAKVVLADGEPTNGTANRSRILRPVGGHGIQADEFRALNAASRRELVKEHRVLYVFHNEVDVAGDNARSEGLVPKAVEDTLATIVDLVKKLANANAANIFVTADHGFLFQDDPLSDSFYLSTKPQGDDLKVVNRRYVLGRGLKADDGFSSFAAAELQIAGEIEVQVPKSIHRLRLPGGGSRYVHGGAALQEVVIPVLKVKKRRRSDTRPVDVKILPESDKITTGQVVVRLLQSEPVTDKIQPRAMRAGLYVGHELISNQVELMFDRTSDDLRDRYQQAQMLLTPEANGHNNATVEFRLEERIPGTTQWRTDQKVMYTLRRSFTSDFDF